MQEVFIDNNKPSKPISITCYLCGR